MGHNTTVNLLLTFCSCQGTQVTENSAILALVVICACAVLIKWLRII